MKKIISFVLITLLLISVFAPFEIATFAATAGQGTVFLMGGAIDQDNSEIYNALKAKTGKNNPVVAVICSATADSDSAYGAYYNDLVENGTVTELSYEHLFQQYGMTPKFVPVAVDNYMTESYSQSNINIINTADIVFFNGGDQARHARALLKDNGSDTPLLAAIRARYNAGYIVAGTSAGCAIMGKPMYGEGLSWGYIYYNDMAHKYITDVSLSDPNDPDGLNGGYMNEAGFGFAPSNAVVDTHFDARGRLGRMLVAMKTLNKRFGIGVDEDTVLSVKNDVGTVYGSGTITMADKISATFPSASNFEVTGMRVSLLTSGDVFNFSNGNLTSSKSLISSPYYSSYYDSADIFSANEVSKTMTRLVDGSYSYAYGDAIDPDGHSSEVYTVKFRKDSATKGYYSNGKYTVSKMIVDIYY